MADDLLVSGDGTVVDASGNIPDALRIEGLYIRGQEAATSLESIGASIDQTAAETEMERWRTLIRQVGGIGSPPDASLIYSGGDVTDGYDDGSNVSWIMADFLSNLDVDADDTYGSSALGPIRNGLILQASGGAFTGQLGGGATLFNAVTQGGLPAGSIWWPLAYVPLNALIAWVLCWYNDGQSTDDSIFGSNLDTHILTVTAGAYTSHVACGFTDRKFYIECSVLSGTTVYMLGGEFHPPFDHVPEGTVGYAQSNNLQVLQTQLDHTHRVARAPQATLSTIANWEFWNGEEWVEDRDEAIELRDTAGILINGAAGFAQVKPGRWVMAAHQLVDTHLDVYGAPAPEGPWTPIARVPMPSHVGRAVDNGAQIAWHTKVLPFLECQAEHSVAMLTAWPQAGAGTSFTDQNIRRYAPIFVVIPWY